MYPDLLSISNPLERLKEGKKRWAALTHHERARLNIQTGIKTFLQKVSAVNSSNIVLALTAYNGGEGMIIGVANNSNVNAINLPGDKNEWTWLDISEALENNVKNFYTTLPDKVVEVLTFYPRIHYVYKYLSENINFNPYDSLSLVEGINFKFPFDAKYNNVIRFTSDFGWRLHPVYKDYRFHYGIDLSAPENTPILSVADGEIVEVDFSSGAGNYIIIKHNFNIHTAYMHLLNYSILVKKGDKVFAGQHIAGVGTTGASTGNHLHFEIRKDRTRIGDGDSSNMIDPKNPYPFLNNLLNKNLNEL
jgi:murein DD-endopeptidase MepM/ murein hydrolase activator NlpD